MVKLMMQNISAVAVAKRLLDALRQRRTLLAIEQADIKERIAALDQTIRRAERLLAQHQPLDRRSAA
jgi:hypothetical protein